MIDKLRRHRSACANIALIFLILGLSGTTSWGLEHGDVDFEDCSALQVATTPGSATPTMRSNRPSEFGAKVLPSSRGPEGHNSTRKTSKSSSLLEAVASLRVGLEQRRANRRILEQRLQNESKEVEHMQAELKKEEPREGRSVLANFLSDVEDEVETNQAVLAAILFGTVVVSVLTCLCSRYTLSQRKAEYMKAEEDFKDRSWPYQCFCGCSPATKVSFYGALVAWLSGLVVLYKMGTLQELMGQIACFFMVLAMIVMALVLVIWEAWMRASGELHNILSFFDHLHEKIDGMLAALGFVAL
eukprot:CAMPEP_0206424464 /NCGR_PEP_ID=MMETSP0324_2-20121206/3244_1 /ASSEMBLY_ACC=CAM_ASM_000836 /TAXON_ID=2866 /ORGANISM="Crypthecodinium cohnii, Strain Seligo" /LENGTH=300 /DNA_ID=CAMNT_0053889125 /DNA_START=290 /DNA_END=1189 /DNA_ORIENTATION=+